MRIPSSDSDTRLWPHHAQCCLIATPLKFWSARLYRLDLRTFGSDVSAAPITPKRKEHV
jgi:hypothetical protein